MNTDEERTAIRPSNNLLKEIAKRGVENVSRCYQCRKCTNGCPVTIEMDLMPNQVMRMVQLGMRERLLDSETIWVCASCETCTTRCPNEIDIAKVMESLRQIAIAEGKTDREPAIPQFHEAFLESIRFNGRVFELGMIGRYKLKSRDFLGDMAIGLEMFKRGKLGFFPHRIKKRSEVKELFRKTRTG